MGLLDDYLLAKTICEMCKTKEQLKPNEELKKKISEKMQFIVL